MNNLKFSDKAITLDEWYGSIQNKPHDEVRSEALVITTDSSTELLSESLNRFAHIVVISADFNDGRIFSIGRQIRLVGYSDRLTLVGDVLLDQYTALLSCGFDDVLLREDLQSTAVIELDQAVRLASPGSSAASSSLNKIVSGINP